MLVKWLIYFSSLSVGRFLLPSPFFGLFFLSCSFFIEETRWFVLWFLHSLGYADCVPIVSFNMDMLKLWSCLLISPFPSPFWSWLLLQFCTGLVTKDSHHFLRVALGHRSVLPCPHDEAQLSAFYFDVLDQNRSYHLSLKSSLFWIFLDHLNLHLMFAPKWLHSSFFFSPTPPHLIMWRH